MAINLSADSIKSIILFFSRIILIMKYVGSVGEITAPNGCSLRSHLRRRPYTYFLILSLIERRTLHHSKFVSIWERWWGPLHKMRAHGLYVLSQVHFGSKGNILFLKIDLYGSVRWLDRWSCWLPVELSLIPVTHTAKGENWLLQVVLWWPHMCHKHMHITCI